MKLRLLNTDKARNCHPSHATEGKDKQEVQTTTLQFSLLLLCTPTQDLLYLIFFVPLYSIVRNTVRLLKHRWYKGFVDWHFYT